MTQQEPLKTEIKLIKKSEVKPSFFNMSIRDYHIRNCMKCIREECPIRDMMTIREYKGDLMIESEDCVELLTGANHDLPPKQL
jgi:hypothetical protein